jgi:UDP-glucose:glycoprotein glucosyltransferase
VFLELMLVIDLPKITSLLKEVYKKLIVTMIFLVSDLSLQAAQQVLNADPKDALQMLIDVSQNFPTVTGALIKTTVSQDFRSEIKRNQEVG